jgi:hypothetical protein
MLTFIAGVAQWTFGWRQKSAQQVRLGTIHFR